jgi:hypothetical protein
VILADSVAYRSLDPPARVGLKGNSSLGLETFCGLEQPDYALGRKILKFGTPAGSRCPNAAGDLARQMHVSLHEAVACH